ncbi:HesA/MoeB/ThiF family protein [Oxyplasma meridianum]|uniref:HesA/MoeB/ThiF family protein n=1 Tax=Oxyplasma meridianum TaxID=3073602 RepID=A0AAX4NI06_9ARCH
MDYLFHARHLVLSRFTHDDLERISRSRVMVVGLGGTGSTAARLFAESGVSDLSIVDQDTVSISNIQRQMYFMGDIGRKKVSATSEYLNRINPDVNVTTYDTVFDSRFAISHAGEFDLIFDGTDNITTRRIINDISVKTGKPWIFSSAIETYGEFKAIVPGKTSCYACFMPNAEGSPQTCSQIGVLNSVPSTVASLAYVLGLRILKGEDVSGDIHFLDAWDMRLEKIKTRRNPDCPVCGKEQFNYLTDQYSCFDPRVMQ